MFDLNSIPEWIGAGVAASGALAGLANRIWKIRQGRRAQAKEIFCLYDPPSHSVIFSNKSPLPITNVIVCFSNPTHGVPGAPSYLDGNAVVSLPVNLLDLELDTTALVVEFTDAAGRRWARQDTLELRRMRPH